MPPKRVRAAKADAPTAEPVKAPAKRGRKDTTNEESAEAPPAKRARAKAPEADATTKKDATKKGDAKTTKKATTKKDDVKTKAPKAAGRPKKTTAVAASKVNKKQPAKAAAKARSSSISTARSDENPNEAEHKSESAGSKKPSPVVEKAPAKETAPPKEEDPLDKIYALPRIPLKAIKYLGDINSAPKELLDVFVCGEGTSGELGLGTAKGTVDVKRPRLNKNLSDKKIVKVATGGMHVLALTADNQILSWGVNDSGALGRDTRWDGGLKDMKEGGSDDTSDTEDDGDTGMNPNEANPLPIPAHFFHPNVQFVDVAAGDSCSFALTKDGRVYGWGIFRANEGELGFHKDIKRQQRTPCLIKEIKNITKIVCGANHVLALDKKGSLWAWGSGQQNQLGRRIVERTKDTALIPGMAIMKHNINNDRRSIKVRDIACGAYNSYCIDERGNLWSWGLNNYGQCGHFENAGGDNAIVMYPTEVPDIPGDLANVDGGGFHTTAINSNGEVYVWGRTDNSALGIDVDDLVKSHPGDIIMTRGNRANEPDPPVNPGEFASASVPKILAKPTRVPDIQGAFAAAGTDNAILLSKQGRAYTTGFNTNYQCGQGHTDDVEEFELVDNTATRERKLIWAGAGGQYSMFAAHKPEQMTNGTS